jgi:hypothetical protein
MLRSSRLFGTACACLLLIGGGVRADQIGWHFEGSGTAVVNADAPGTGGVTFVYDPPAQALGDSHVSLANLWTFSEAAPASPELFSNAPFSVALTITDGPSGKSGTTEFTGAMHGLLSGKSALLMTAMSSPARQSLVLGDNLYTVLLAGFSPPGPPESNNAGALSALVTVQPNHVPEPAALVLAGLGVAGLGVGAWRKRRFLRIEDRG